MSLYSYIFCIVILALLISLTVTIATAIRIFENQNKLSEKIDELIKQLKEKAENEKYHES